MTDVAAFAPCRLGLAGGGTDLPSYADRFGGAVFSATITLGATARVARVEPPRVELSLPDFGARAVYDDVDDARGEKRKDVALAAAIIAEVAPGGGVRADVRTGLPPGSGLGTSGAVGVALTFALRRLAGKDPSPGDVAETASVVEIERVGRPIGRQDQYAAAFGGLNLWRFAAEGVRREPLGLPAEDEAAFARYFMLFFSGRRRDSAEVLAGQRERVLAGDEGTVAALHRNRDAAVAMAAAVKEGDFARAGALMHAGWLAKIGASTRVADDDTARLAETARARGAWAMKVCGAGAGGFYMVMAPPAAREKVAAFLASEGYTRFDFAFEPRGVRPITP